MVRRHQQSRLEISGGEREAPDSQQSWPAAAAAGCTLPTPPAAQVSTPLTPSSGSQLPMCHPCTGRIVLF